MSDHIGTGAPLFARRADVRIAALLLFVCVGVTGCAAFRGIPSHGGGKRFDEEQRIVAGAIREAVAGMALTEIEGKRTRIQLVSVPTSGAGNITFGGLQDINANVSLSDSEYNLVRRLIPLLDPTFREVFRWVTDDELYEPQSLTKEEYNAQSVHEKRRDKRTSWGAGLRYRLDHSYYTQRTPTDGDINYLQAVLEMKARHCGVTIDGGQPVCMLYVLVDVLGTNRRRRDYLVWKKDDLAATCEMTYYARDFKTGELLFAARRAAGMARYEEDRIWPLGTQVENREYAAAVPSPFPTTCTPSDLQPVGLGPDSGDTTATSRPAPNGTTPEYLDQLIDRARSQFRAGNSQDAYDALRRVIAADPNHPGLREIKDEFDIELPTP